MVSGVIGRGRSHAVKVEPFPAGDFVKFGFPFAGAMTQVAWGAVSFQSGYEAAGQLDYLKAVLKWGTDYMIAAHTSADEFVGQVQCARR